MTEKMTDLDRNKFAIFSYLHPFSRSVFWIQILLTGMLREEETVTSGHGRSFLGSSLCFPFVSLSWLPVCRETAGSYYHHCEQWYDCIMERCSASWGPGGRVFGFISLTVRSNLNWNWCDQNCGAVSADYLDRKNIGWHGTWRKCSLNLIVLASRKLKAIQHEFPSRIVMNDERLEINEK